MRSGVDDGIDVTAMPEFSLYRVLHRDGRAATIHFRFKNLVLCPNVFPVEYLIFRPEVVHDQLKI